MWEFSDVELWFMYLTVNVIIRHKILIIYKINITIRYKNCESISVGYSNDPNNYLFRDIQHSRRFTKSRDVTLLEDCLTNMKNNKSNEESSTSRDVQLPSPVILSDNAGQVHILAHRYIYTHTYSHIARVRGTQCYWRGKYCVTRRIGKCFCWSIS